MIAFIARQSCTRWKNSVAALPGIRNLAAVPQKLQLVKDLRESSGAPISDVKAALDEAKYDVGEARQRVRMQSRWGSNQIKNTAEGIIGVVAVYFEASCSQMRDMSPTCR